MKKLQFYMIAAALVADCILFAMCFITSFAGFACLFDARGIDLGVMHAFSYVFLLVGNIMAPIVRECYEEAYGEQ